jgi:hypothetical protein
MAASEPKNALECARRGWCVFPLPAGAKEPPPWTDYVHKASRNPTRIIAWHGTRSGCNWGIVPGPSGLLIVDVDDKLGKNGSASLAELELTYSKLPKTFAVRTPSGGLHYYFHGQHVFKLGFRPGLDCPQYVLAPGSMLADGNRYTVIDDSPVAVAPDWLIEVIGEAVEHEHVDQDYLVEPDQAHEIQWYREWLRDEAPLSIMFQGGGDVLVKMIVPVGKDRGLSRDTVKDILCEAGGYNETKCKPPWDLTDDNANGLFKKVDNGFDYCTGSAPGAATAQADFTNDPPPTDAEIEAFAAWWKEFDASPTEMKKRERSQAHHHWRRSLPATWRRK